MNIVTRANHMKPLGMVALVLGLAVATVNAQQPVKMTFSGTSGASAINLQQPGTTTGEDSFAGSGALGQFTFRNVTSETISPQTPPSTCSGTNNLYFLRVTGAGVLRFHDGSLLKVTMTEGADCVDLAAGEAHCTLALQITGGTGRFTNASGVLTMTETISPVLGDAFGNPVLFAGTGELTGTILGVGGQGNEDSQ